MPLGKIGSGKQPDPPGRRGPCGLAACSCNNAWELRIRRDQHPANRMPAIPFAGIVNVFPSLKRGDFRLLEADVPARDEEIDRRVDVPVMRSTTSATAPLSHYEALSTLWAAACTARGTDLRGRSLVNLDVLSA